jgi:hypothetical protein
MDTLVFQNTFLLQQVAVMFFVQNFSFIDPLFLTPCLKLDMSNKQDDDDDEKTMRFNNPCVKCD